VYALMMSPARSSCTRVFWGMMLAVECCADGSRLSGPEGMGNDTRDNYLPSINAEALASSYWASESFALVCAFAGHMHLRGGPELCVERFAERIAQLPRGAARTGISWWYWLRIIRRWRLHQTW
jgi:hypothetical protein